MISVARTDLAHICVGVGREQGHRSWNGPTIKTSINLNSYEHSCVLGYAIKIKKLSKLQELIYFYKMYRASTLYISIATNQHLHDYFFEFNTRVQIISIGKSAPLTSPPVAPIP